jgi:hypothetical protein
MPAIPDAGRRWWPRALGASPPDERLLVVIEPADGERATVTVENWPEVGADGRLHRTAPRERAELEAARVIRAASPDPDLPFMPRSDPPAAVAIPATDDPVLPDALPKDAGNPIDRDQWDRAFGAHWEPYVWSTWETWRGDVDLLVRIARAIQQALADIAGGESTIAIDVFKQGDREPFASPEALRDDITKSAARAMDAIHMRAAADGICVELRITRDKDPDRPWLRRAALLEVFSTEPAHADAIRAVHARVYAAMARGATSLQRHAVSAAQFRARDAEGGLVEAAAYGPAVVAEQSAALGRFALLLLVFVVYVIGVPVVEAFGTAGLLASLAVGAVIGLIVGISVFLGGISLGASNRVLAARAVIVTAASTVFGAALGAGVRAIVEAL